MIGKSVKPTDDFELRSWFFMRVSGILIVLLVGIHLLFVHFVHGVDEINSNFVMNRWLNPTWRIMDFLLLSLATLHGGNGMRILIDDYIRPKGWRTFLLTSLYIAVFLLLALGSVVMLTV